MSTKVGRVLKSEATIERVIYLVTLFILVLTPLTFSTWAYRVFALPRFIVLLLGSASLLVCFCIFFRITPKKFWGISTLSFPQRIQLISAFGFLTVILISTVFGVSPIASFWGSFENQMGFITRFCFLIVFTGLIFGIGKNQERFQNCLLAISATGILVSLYAIIQYFGRDPFLPTSLYSFDSPQGKIIRVISSLGHSNYLGNFLLYTTPVSLSFVFISEGSARRAFALGTLLSLTAIIMSGTRGAWLGLLIGLSFFIYQIQPRVRLFFRDKRKRVAFITMSALVLMFLLWVINSNRYSNPLLNRTRSTFVEGFTGSGRTLLWRDSLKMLPKYLVVGCGPEGFRKAFLFYKSKELTQLAPQTNNESPHNAYLEAIISFGLLGGVLYVLLIVSSLFLIFKAKQLVVEEKHKIFLSGLATAIIAVGVHNVFIFDQIPTGLYFFAFAGLSQAAFIIASHRAKSEDKPERNKVESSSLINKIAGWTMLLASFCVLGLATWYSLSLLRADSQLREATNSTNKGDVEKTFQFALSFNPYWDMDGSYSFAMARTLAVSADMIQAKIKSSPNRPIDLQDLLSAKAKAIDLATIQASRSTTYSLTPDSSFLLLAYLSNLKEDFGDSERYARAALHWDPYAPNAHWLLAEARLAQHDFDTAVLESESALELNPYSREARQTLKKAQGTSGSGSPDELVERALKLLDKGKVSKAKILVSRATRISDGKCPACTEALAKIEALEHQ